MKTTLYIFILLLLLALTTSQAQTSNRKIITDKGCGAMFGQDCVTFDDLGITEKQFSKYIKTNYARRFPKTVVEFHLEIDPALNVCCKRVIYDSIKMTPGQISLLKNVVLKYPHYDKIKFRQGDKSKMLTILLCSNKRKQPKAIFLGCFK